MFGQLYNRVYLLNNRKDSQLDNQKLFYDIFHSNTTLKEFFKLCSFRFNL